MNPILSYQEFINESKTKIAKSMLGFTRNMLKTAPGATKRAIKSKGAKIAGGSAGFAFAGSMAGDTAGTKTSQAIEKKRRKDKL